MTPAGAEIFLIGILAGFFVSRVMQQFTAERTATFDEQSYAQLEKALDAALERRLASGGLVAAAPVAMATATAVAEPTSATADEAETATVEETPAATEADAPAVPEGETVTMKVTTMDGQTHTLEVNYGENMLDAALDRNVDLDYSCKDGGCDTCTVKILSGMEYLEDIYDAERDMLDEEQLASGHRLSCLVHVRGPVELIQEER